MSLVSPLAAWPVEDQQMWRVLTADGGPLDDQGALAHLRAASLETLKIRYGRWLGWLQDTDDAALASPPAARATMARMTAWLGDLAHTAPMSRLTFASGALRVLAQPRRTRTGRRSADSRRC